MPTETKRQRPAGRPTGCTSRVIAAVAGRVREGVPPRVAAMALGVSSATYHRWVEKAEHGEQPFREFWEQIQRSEAQFFEDLIAVVRKAAVSDRDAKMALTVLERRLRGDFAPAQRGVHKGAPDTPVVVQHRVLWVSSDDPTSDEAA